MWLAAGLAVALGGLVVLVAALAERDTTVAPSRVGSVTPHDLRTVRFPLVWRGYDPGHVDAMLARAAVALDDAQHYGAPATEGELPDFLAETFDDEAGPETTPTPASTEEASGEELEDGGGDRAGGLDR